MLIIQALSYIHPDKDTLFNQVHLVLNRHDKLALTGINGSGKSTLLKLIAGMYLPTSGTIQTEVTPYYVPQIFGQYNQLTVAEALQVSDKLNALHAILNGDVSEQALETLDDDWTIEERVQSALSNWGLAHLNLQQLLEGLSGGQITKVFLAGITLHSPELILLDEPSNHLDRTGRDQLYQLIRNTSATLLVVSHDTALLQLMQTIGELHTSGLQLYGGNFDFYRSQKEQEATSLTQDIHIREKALREARKKERETIEKQHKLDARGKKKQEQSGVARIMMNTLRNNAENSTSKMQRDHAHKIDDIGKDLHHLRAQITDKEQMKFGFDQSGLHTNKLIFKASEINFSYGTNELWNEPQSFEIRSGERIAISGTNGSGKTTLIQLILGTLEPTVGSATRNDFKSVYMDQEYSLIEEQKSIYEQAQSFNHTALQEHEVKIRLNRFLFPKDTWEKSCRALSGGERMRLLLCCLHIGNQAPDLIILDEPTNNLDLHSNEILTSALNDYKGTLILVSHDEDFLNNCRFERVINL